MTEYGRTKSFALGATIALAGLLIAIISAQNSTALFPEILFYIIVIILISLIAVLVVYDFFGIALHAMLTPSYEKENGIH